MHIKLMAFANPRMGAILGLITYLVMVRIIPVTSDRLDPVFVKEFLENETISLDEIKEYLKIELGLEELEKNSTRLFPLCISSVNAEKRGMQDWSAILQKMEKAYDCGERPIPYYAFDKNKHLLSDNKSDWIINITLSRLYSPYADLRNLRQWMLVQVDTPPDVKGLFLQTIVGPLGLPSGKFSLEKLPCGIKKQPKESRIEYCDYRSGADINHPVVYFGKADNESESEDQPQKKTFEVNYQWQDISCLESPYLQFILIPVKSFSNPVMGVSFLPLLSPVYTNFKFDSHDGLPTPYYVDMSRTENLECKKGNWEMSTAVYHDTKEMDLSWKISESLRRIPFNEDYERCLLASESDNLRNEIRKLCYAPGPFECTEGDSLFDSAVSSSSFKTIEENREHYFNHKILPTSECLPCFPPSEDELDLCPVIPTPAPVTEETPTTTESSGEAESSTSTEASTTETPKPKPKIRTPFYLDLTEILNSGDDARQHGAICILAYLVILPISNFIGRFYRETVIFSWWKSDVDFWIVLHAVIHIINWVIVWASIGYVSSGHESVPIYAEECFVEAQKGKYFHILEEDEKKALDDLENCIEDKVGFHYHAYIGMGAVILSTLMIISGFIRNTKNYIRNIEIIIHSHGGQGLYALAIAAILTAAGTKSCMDTKVWGLALIIITILAYLVATWLSFHEDEHMGVDPGRYQWPILEHIKLFDKSPAHKWKLLLLCVYVFLLFMIWGLLLLSFSKIANSEDRIFAGVTEDHDDDEKHVVKGWFGECRASSLQLNWD